MDPENWLWTKSGIDCLNSIVEIIVKNAYPPIPAGDIKAKELMFAYGTTDEFRSMISDIEDKFDIVLPALNGVDDIGEKTVEHFIKMIAKHIQPK